MASGFVTICNEGHVWMPQSWKQGQVRLIPNNDKPQTIGDAQHTTLLNAHNNMHTHVVAWLRDSMTTFSQSWASVVPSKTIAEDKKFPIPGIEPGVTM